MYINEIMNNSQIVNVMLVINLFVNYEYESSSLRWASGQ